MRFAITLLALALCACSGPPQNVVVHDSDATPALLSEWGLLNTSGGTLNIHDESVPYELHTALFSDYALKLRTVWMPDGAAAEYRDESAFEFPVGTIISKTFLYEKHQDWGTDTAVYKAVDAVTSSLEDLQPSLDDYRLVETRLLVRYEDGWRGFPYVWNAEQTDATLEIAGDIQQLALRGDGINETINYLVPDVNQCAGCHTPDHSAGDLRPIGPQAWQLNRPYAHWGDGESQLSHWQANNMLSGAPEAPPQVGDSLQERTKAYLDANCAHCHNPKGAADTSALHLNIESPVDRHFGVCKSPVAVGRGSGDRPFDIVPGKPGESIMLYRMQHSDPAIAMPELGRSTVHRAGMELVQAWISGLSGTC